MNTFKILSLAVALIAFVCMVTCADEVAVDASTKTTAQATSDLGLNPDCPVQRSVGFMSNLMNRIRGLGSATSSSSATVSAGLNRRKRQATDAFGQPINNQPPALVQPTNMVQPGAPGGQLQPTAQEVVAYDQNVQREEGRLRSMINQLMSSQYMPSRDQVIQLLTTMLTLGLMMFLGPVLGSNANMVQAIVRQIVPFIVTAGVHYAADQAMPVKPIEAPITNVQLAPVQTAPSTYGQTF